MKKTIIISSLLFLFLLTSCKTKKETNELFGTTWELEYFSGPGDGIEVFFKNKKPRLNFNQETKKVEGNSGCNGYSADFTLQGNRISFGEPGPTTMMYCGEGESFFLGILKRVNTYRIDDKGKLSLMVGDVPFLRFKKTE